jgi:hypothetical protein
LVPPTKTASCGEFYWNHTEAVAFGEGHFTISILGVAIRYKTLPKEWLDYAAMASQTRRPHRRKPGSPPTDTQATASPSPSCVELSCGGNVGGDIQRLQALAQAAWHPHCVVGLKVTSKAIYERFPDCSGGDNI